MLTSTDPAGGASTWTAFAINAGALASVSCPSSSLCVAAASYGTVAVSTDPTGGARAWSIFQVPTSTPGECGKYGPGVDCWADLTGVSCPSVSMCVAVDEADGGQGDVISSSDPTGGPSTWKFVPVDHRVGLDGVSCPGVSLCVAVDGDARLLISRAPLGEAPVWSVTQLRYGRVGGGYYGPQVACGSPALCLQPVGDAVAVSSDPTGGASTWNVTSIDRHNPYGLEAVSCAATTVCVAVDGSGHIVAGVSAAPIVRLLRRALLPTGRARRIPTLAARNGYLLKLRAPSDGRLTVSCYGTSTSSTLATGHAALTTGTMARIRMTLTSLGKRLLSQRRIIRVTADATLVRPGWTPVSTTIAATLMP